MPSLKGSPPFRCSVDELKHLGELFGLAVVGLLGTFATTILIPWLTAHESNQLGVAIVAMLAAGLPVAIEAARKFFGDTRGNSTPPVAGRTYLLLPLAGLLALGWTSTAMADVALRLPSAPGSYVVTITKDASGNWAGTAVPLDAVISPLTPGPVPNPTPTPGPLSPNAIAIRDTAAKITNDQDRATTAHGLAELYRQIAKLVRTPGQVASLDSLVTAVHSATDMFLASRGSGAAAQWKPVRDKFGEQWTALTAKGSPLGDYATLLDEAGSGLDASAPVQSGAEKIPPEVWDFIIKVLLPLILQLLMPKP